jgi:hypothetical protein
MTRESIKQFLKPDCRKEAIFGAFLVLGWICFLGILDVSNMAEIFFLLPFAIILEIFSPVLFSYTFLMGMIFSLIYWYVFSCLLIFLSDILIKICQERFFAKDTRTKDFPKSKLNKGLNKGISAREQNRF